MDLSDKVRAQGGVFDVVGKGFSGGIEAVVRSS